MSKHYAMLPLPSDAGIVRELMGSHAKLKSGLYVPVLTEGSPLVSADASRLFQLEDGDAYRRNTKGIARRLSRTNRHMDGWDGEKINALGLLERVEEYDGAVSLVPDVQIVLESPHGKDRTRAGAYQLDDGSDTNPEAQRITREAGKEELLSGIDYTALAFAIPAIGQKVVSVGYITANPEKARGSPTIQAIMQHARGSGNPPFVFLVDKKKYVGAGRSEEEGVLDFAVTQVYVNNEFFGAQGLQARQDVTGTLLERLGAVGHDVTEFMKANPEVARLKELLKKR